MFGLRSSIALLSLGLISSCGSTASEPPNGSREPKNRGFNEASRTKELGMVYVSIPIGSADDLTAERFERLRDALKTKERPILMHGASYSRFGAVWLAWHVLDEGQELEAAAAEAKLSGLRSDRLENAARAYIGAQ